MRHLIELDRSATILDVAERIAQAPADDDIVLVGAAGAPWLRNAVFIDVARGLAGARRFALVSSDPRARSLAASVHIPGYASVDALDRHELDATERLERRPARRPATRAALRAPALTGRTLAIGASLLAAFLVLLGVVGPSAEVVVAPTTQPLGPVELQVRAGPGGDIARTDLSDTVTTKLSGRATGSREEPVKARGNVLLQNRQTQDFALPRGTPFRTADGALFLSTEARTLPKSTIFFPITLTVGSVEVPIEAERAGPAFNVPAGRITVSPRPSDYTVSNPQPTTGGDVKKIPVVRRQDYDAVAATAPAKVQEAAEARLARWRTEARPGTTVIARAYSTPTSVSPASDVVDREVETFEVTATGVATAFAVSSDEPRKTALDRLRQAAAPGFALNEPTAQVDARLLEDPARSGLIAWTVTAKGVQLARVDGERIRRALAGRGVGEARAALDREGVQLVDVRTEPAWWPRLPVLDARIRVVEVPARVASP